MPRNRKFLKRSDSDEYFSGDSLDNDDIDSGLGSEGDYMSDGVHSDGVTSDPTGNRRRFGRRFRKRFNKSADNDVDLLNEPRRVNRGNSRARSTSHDSTEMNPMSSESRFTKFRQRINPFSGGSRRTKSADDLDSLGLGSAGGNKNSGKSPSAIRNWRRKGNKEGDTGNNNSEPPIRNVSFDASTGPAASTTLSNSGSHENLRDALSHNQSSAQNLMAEMSQPRSEGRRARYSVYHGNRSVKKKFRVRPYHVFSEPRHLTEEDIYADSTQPSVYYEFLKSYLQPTVRPSKKMPVPEEIRELFGTPAFDGRIGSLRVEVLGCVSLDRQKPDVCVYLVAGDAAFCTDVIQGYRSPMWPCESKRAAVFPLHHAYTQLYVGVFDVRQRKNKENDVFCGRISIDIATLRPDTEYDITFPLRVSTLVYDRRKRGVIRLRFSLHWFSERAAVLSYFKGPRSLSRSNPLLGGYPTIPCADPKTFRNVAYTVYGSDLPGKYSRTAFRATVREFNLYHVNFRFVVKTLILDAILYEKPYISAYLFVGGLYLIWMEAVRLVPPFWLMYFMIQYWENYYHFVVETSYNEGYQQLTALEVFYGLLFNSMRSDRNYFRPIILPKRAKKRGGRARHATGKTLRRFDSDLMDDTTAEDEDIALEDHKEFPFSHRDGYPKFGVEDSLAPSKSGGGTQRLHGRLSVYYQSPADDDEGADQNNGEDEDSDGSDDETIITTTGIGDTMLDMDNLEDEDEEEEELEQIQYGGRSRKKPRVHLGTPQSNDVAGRKVPPQVTLKKIEYLFHKMSLKVAYELVAAPPLEAADGGNSTYVSQREKKEYEELDESEKKAAAALKRKYPMDEFDRLLALEFKSANPVNRILASFLGPLMRMGRTVIYVIRIAFNATTWRDPFLSFWIFMFLFSVLLLLLVFPWRAFFFLSTVVLVGPQNILIRRILEKQAESREKEKREAALAAMDNSGEYGAWGSNISTGSGESSSQKRSTAYGVGMGLVGVVGSVGSAVVGGTKGRSTRRGGKRPSIDNMESMIRERPPFSSDLHGRSSSKKLSPRSVAIPYSRVRKERFYDWPPDPTVSRATPLQIVGPAPVDPTNVLRHPEKQEEQDPHQVQRDEDDSIESFDDIVDMNIGSIDGVDNFSNEGDTGPYEPVSKPSLKPADETYEPVHQPASESSPVSQPLDMPIPSASSPRHQTIDQQLRQRKFVAIEMEHNETHNGEALNQSYGTDDDAYMAEYEAMGYG